LGEGVLSNKDLFTNYTATELSAPGFTPTPHSKSLFINHFHSYNYFAGGLQTIYKITPDFHFRIEGYCFLPIKEEVQKENEILVKKNKLFDNYYWQGMAALVYQTGIGPASISLNYYEKNDTKLYLTLNFGYILFNKRGQ
jgi:NTE family protein